MNLTSWDYRISLTESGLGMGSLASYHIPAPNVAPFLDSAIETDRGDGGQGLHGCASIEVLWDRLMMAQAAKVRWFIDNAKSGTGLLYMTVAVNDASSIGYRWVDVSGMPHRPRQAADSGDIGNRQPGGLQYIDNYLLFLNNLTVINNPSVYTVF